MVLLLGIISGPLGGIILDKKWLLPKTLLILSHGLLALGYIAIGNSVTVPMALAAIIFTEAVAWLPFGGIFNYAVYSCPKNPGLAMGFVNTWGVMILPLIIGRLVDVTGTFISGFYVLAGVAFVGSLAASVLVRREECII
ncbi:MAG: hypothetical protein ACLP9S_14755 [Syntrophales bacterium]